MKIRIKIILISFSFCWDIFAQTPLQNLPDSIKYRKGEFMFPILPGQQNFLSGTFAEIRRNHFHGGLDIKTRQQEGLPVYAAADGYISKIKINKDGYGNLIYMTHPNGYTTLYAHLKKLDKPLEDFLREMQYKAEKFEIEIPCPPKRFRYHKGDTIAFSGNTGSSRGPHLHFEIRDKQGNGINPLLFGLDEIKDNVKPVIGKMALRTFDINSRVNGEFGRFEFALDDDNKPLKPIKAQGIIGIEINAWDLLNSSSNHTGIYSYEVFVDSQFIFMHSIEKVSVENTRYINCHIDYLTATFRSINFQKCYVEDGNRLNTYTFSDNVLKGRIVINENRNYSVKIKVSDANQNVSWMSFNMEGSEIDPANLSIDPCNVTEVTQSKFEYDLLENILKIENSVKSVKYNKIFVFLPYKQFMDSVIKPEIFVLDTKLNTTEEDEDDNQTEIEKESESEVGGGYNDDDVLNGTNVPECSKPKVIYQDSILSGNKKVIYISMDKPAYIIEKKNIFLYDIRNGYPDSLSNGLITKTTSYRTTISPYKKNFFKADNIQILFTPNFVNDTLYLEYFPKIKKDLPFITEFKLNDRLIPVYKEFFIRMKVDTLKFSTDRVAGYSVRTFGGNKYESSTWKNNIITFKTKTLGSFSLIADKVKPTIQVLSATYLKNMRLLITDNLSGIQSYRAEVDGKWILMEWDAKYHLIYTNADDPKIPSEGEFVLKVCDNVGNVAEYKKKF